MVNYGGNDGTRPQIPGAVNAAGLPRVTARARVEAAIATADQVADDYGVFVTRTDLSARAAAAAADTAVAHGRDPGRLAGMTIVVKDLIATCDAPTTAQSLVHDDEWFGCHDAPVVASLREAGAALMGKTSMAEHGLGRVDPGRPFPAPRNPWDPTRWPGGSSSGTAIAVAFGIADAGLGTDTTGSLRIPSAFCGVTGLRPTFGLVPIVGCMPTARSLDVIGPIARSARDCASVLAIIATSPQRNEIHWRDRLDGVVIGVPWQKLDTWGDQIADDVRSAFERALNGLKVLGAKIVPFDWPEADDLTKAAFTITLAEAFAVHLENFRNRWSEYGRSFRRIAAAGALIPPDIITEVRSTLRHASASIGARMVDVDAVATPTWAKPPPGYGAGQMGLGDLNLTAPWSVSGQPVLATPMGFDSLRLPMSLQLVGKAGQDQVILEIADAYERATGWGRVHPARSPGPFPPISYPDSGRLPPADDRAVLVEQSLAGWGISPEPRDIAALCQMVRRLAEVRSASSDKDPSDLSEVARD